MSHDADAQAIERPVGGEHYRRTAEAWLENLDRNRAAILQILRRTRGRGEELRWLVRWRVFFMACAELFGSNGGANGSSPTT